MARKDRIELIRKIQERRESRLICCLTSDRQNVPAAIAKDFIPKFFDHLSAFGQPKKVDVFLLTTGGDILAAFGLSRLVREFTDSVGALVPEKCHSAGTLLVLGANEIFMGKAATLTPIDPSVNTLLNPVVEVAPGQRQFLPVSVESVAGYKSLVKEDWRLGNEGASIAFRILADKINPLALGDVYRSRQQIKRLAQTLINYHRHDERNIKKIVEKLTGGFGSHDYPISRTEARQLLGPQIARDDEELARLIWDLLRDFREEMRLGQIFDAGMVVQAAAASRQPLPVLDEHKVAVIESENFGDEFERALQLSAVQTMTPAGPVQAFQAALVRQGWKHYD
jgi:hypothetical protein